MWLLETHVSQNGTCCILVAKRLLETTPALGCGILSSNALQSDSETVLLEAVHASTHTLDKALICNTIDIYPKIVILHTSSKYSYNSLLAYFGN